MYFGLGTSFGDEQSWILYLHNNKTFLLQNLGAAHSHCMSINPWNKFHNLMRFPFGPLVGRLYGSG